MTDAVNRRELLRRMGGAVAGGSLAAVTPPARALASPVAGASVPPRPVGPVNAEVAARHGMAYKAMPREATGVDVESLITIGSVGDLVSRRAALIDYVWKGAGLPFGAPRVRQDVAVPELAALRSLRRIDELSVPLAHAVSSRLFHVLPQCEWNRRLAVYHNGHGEPLGTMLRTTQALLDRGYSVLACAMPFKHWNPPSITEPGDARRRTVITSHDDLARWESAGFSALTFFLEPVAIALNHVTRTYRPTSVQMIGLSGGGWTTTVYAAIDPRVTRSYPAAGSVPFYLRSAPPNACSTTGDWEQRRDALPGFYAIAGFLDLYLMAAVGPGRRQIQILNRFDPCCFSGVGHRGYAPAVSHRAAVIGDGHWELVEDATHDRHTISPYALSVILHDLGVHADG
ncbi:hypothetical protein ACRYCC_05025 [Actinomadura scrupuli]|uniref:hypothetical protein n=1 Tax=Actinomadura scrupuli TaxID=559629 RepID=UPI003D9716BC